MTIKITIERITPSTWEWRITRANVVLAGGYCRTMKAAKNDAGIVFSKLDVN